MFEWTLIFLGGLLGSSHCIGMCGAFAITIGMGAPTLGANVRRQLLYSLGRICTYSFAGAVAGTLGRKLQSLPIDMFPMQTALALVAGGLLVIQGAYSAGLLPRIVHRNHVGSCPSHTLFRTFLTGSGWLNAFLAGLLTGFLPCGLVYAYLVLAAGTGSVGHGAAIMALFGSGTIPLMVLAGAGASLLSLVTRARLLRVAACCVIITGILTISRGIGWARPADPSSSPVCPFCTSETAVDCPPEK